MKKLHIISLFSLILSASFFFFWSLTRDIGIFMLWIPERLHTELHVEKEPFVTALNTLFHGTTNDDAVWQWTIGAPQDMFLYISVFFGLLCLIAFGFSWRKNAE